MPWVITSKNLIKQKAVHALTNKGSKGPSQKSTKRHPKLEELQRTLQHSIFLDPVEPDEREYSEEVQDFVRNLPEVTPQEIFDELGTSGYVGQEQPRKALSLMAYRHMQRLRNIYIREVDPLDLPPKSNHLLMGPTGSGKTYLVELLFRHILKIPTVLVDITTYSETGYVGQDVGSILTRLLYAADGNQELAELGIVCLDEFDKIASGQNNAVFAGAGTTKDISGLVYKENFLSFLNLRLSLYQRNSLIPATNSMS